MNTRTLMAASLSAAALAACAGPYYDYDDNPPGPRGGWGTNWENPPGPAGGPGASPDRYYRYQGGRYAFSPRQDGYYYNGDLGYYHPRYGWLDNDRQCWRGRDWTPSRRVGASWATPRPATGYRSC
jgi:hypothetical protein